VIEHKTTGRRSFAGNRASSLVEPAPIHGKIRWSSSVYLPELVLSEPDVTLTDYGLAVECAIFAALLVLTPTARRGLRAAGSCFFIFLGLAAVTGGSYHGFCAGLQTPGGRLLWQLTMQLAGLAAFSTWVLGAGVLIAGPAWRWLAFAALPQILFYSLTVLFFTQKFWIVFAIYFPAALLLLAGFCRGFWRDGHRYFLVGASGSVLSLVSSFIQFMRIGVDPLYFNHNALAHAVQAVALAMLFVAIRSVVGSAVPESRLARTTILSQSPGQPHSARTAS
jgi:hypothetical protein